MSNGHKKARRHAKFRQKLYRPFKRRSGVGAAPGSVHHDSDASPSRVHRFVYNDQSLREYDDAGSKKIADVSEGVQWIDVSGLGDTELLHRIGDTFKIHPLTLEDIVHTHQRPKAEIVADRLVVMLRLADQQTPPALEQISFVLCGRTLITFQERVGDSFDPVRRRLRESLGRIREHDADFLMYCLIDAAIDAYFPMLEEYGRTLEQLEDEVTLAATPQANTQIREIKRELSVIRKISYAHREAMNRLVQDASGHVSESTQLFFRDCVDHATQILEVTESFREVVSDLRDLYFTQLSQRTNDVMRVLTIISTVFIPMTFIAGVYGMNFDRSASRWNMPETEWRYGYPFALLLMAAMACSMVVMFWKKGWLKR